jgi:sugar lactone lactonase YvrE
LRHATVLSIYVCLVGSVFADTGLITTVAGTGVSGSAGINGPATQAYLNNPYCVALDSSGNLYIADSGNYRVVRVEAATGILTLRAGAGSSSYSGDGGPAIAAAIGSPNCIALDTAGNFYITDSINNVVRRVDAAAGTISTVAGGGSGGDNGPALNARLLQPSGIAVDAQGNLFITELLGYRVRKVSAASRVITTVAGNGASAYGGDGGPAILASLRYPVAAAVDAAGNLYISDSQDGRLRRVDASSGVISTVAGIGVLSFSGDGGPAAAAGLSNPGSIAVDASGNLFVTDNDRVRRIDAATSFISTVAGINGEFASPPDGVPATSAALLQATGLALLPSGNLFVSEQLGERVRRVFLPGNTRTYTATVVSSNIPDTVSGQSVTITASVTPIGGVGTPSGTVRFWSVAGTGFPTDLGSAPVVNGSASVTIPNLVEGSLSITAGYLGDAAFWSSGSPAIGVRVHQATTTTITSSPNPSNPGQWVAVTVTVANAAGPSQYAPAGSVRLIVGPAVLTASSLNDGIAYFLTPFNVAPGSFPLVATYTSDGGPGDYGGSVSAPLTQVVVQKGPSTTSASVQWNPGTSWPAPGQLVTITASVSPAGATGTVQFLDGTTVLGTIALNAGSAVLSTSSLSSGPRTITANYSGDVGNSSSSGTATVTVKTATTTTVSSNNNPGVYGIFVPFVAQVSPAAATGTVQFFDGAQVLGPPSSLSGGTVTFTPFEGLPAGDRSIICVYSGDALYVGSTSSVYIETIAKGVSSVSLSSSPNPSSTGQSVSITVQLSPPYLSGSIQLLDNTTVLATVNAVNGTAVFTTTSLVAGSHSLSANYSGDANWKPASTSAPYTQTVKAITTTSVTAQPNPVASGQSATITATVLPAGATGTVQFLDGATVLGTGTLSAGSAALATSVLSSGSHTITANYSGDSGNSPSSGTVNLTVKTATITTVSSNNNPQQYGIAVQLIAQVSPAAATGTVQFFDGAQSLGSAPLSGGTVTFPTGSNLTVGNHPITCVYSGDATYAGSTSSVFTETIGKGVPSLSLSSSPNPSLTGQSLSITVQIFQTSATGTIQFLDNTTVLATVNAVNGTAVYTTTSLAAGSHSLSANYSGDANWQAASALTPYTQTVKAITTTSVTAQPNPVISGQLVTIAATVSPTGATGTVQFLDGTAALGTVALSAGSAALSTSALSAGSHTITASYSGDSGNNPSSGTANLTVKTATVTTVSPNRNPGQYGLPIQLAAQVSPAAATGTVQFFDGAQPIGSAPLSGGTATLNAGSLTVGVHSITCVYSGDAAYVGSTSSVFTETIAKGVPSLSLSSSPNPSSTGQSVSITVQMSQTSATGTIQFLDNGTALGTVNAVNGTAVYTTTSLALGSHSLSANYSGDANWQVASTSVSYTQTVKATTTTTLTSGNNTQQVGNPVKFTAKVSPSAATGVVQFLDGGQQLNTAVLSGGTAILTVTFTSGGDHPISCVYSGDATHAGSTSTVLTQTINKLKPSLTLDSSPNPSAYGQSVTMTASAPANATGTMQFMDNGTVLATVDAVNGAAVYTTASLTSGSHTLSVSYSGDPAYQSATVNAPGKQIIRALTVTTLAASPNPGVQNKPVVFTATVSPAAATGQVRFFDGSTSIGTKNLSGGSASFSVSNLALGVHSITVSYQGDATFNASTAAALLETITR